MGESKKSVFETLNSINVNGHTEKKNGLTYLSWAWAWAEVKKVYPKATFTNHESQNGLNYFSDGKTAWVKVSVTIEDESVTETLPIMDFKNKSVPVGNVTSMDVNKALKRCLVKALALMGLGLYIYAGEDLPEDTSPKETLERLMGQYKELLERTQFGGGKTYYQFLQGCLGDPSQLSSATNGLIDWLQKSGYSI